MDPTRLAAPPAHPSVAVGPLPAPLDAANAVPLVRLRHRRDGWTLERQRVFLAALAENGNVAAAAAEAGVSARSAFRLRAHPAGQAFARAWDAAVMTAAGSLLSVAFQRAVEGTPRQIVRDGRVVAEQRRPSDRMLMFLLRHLHPELFGYAGPAPRRAAAMDALRGDYPPALDLLVDLGGEACGAGDLAATDTCPVDTPALPGATERADPATLP